MLRLKTLLRRYRYLIVVPVVMTILLIALTMLAKETPVAPFIYSVQ